MVYGVSIVLTASYGFGTDDLSAVRACQNVRVCHYGMYTTRYKLTDMATLNTKITMALKLVEGDVSLKALKANGLMHELEM